MITFFKYKLLLAIFADKEHVVEHVNTCWKSRPLYLERLTLVVVGRLPHTHRRPLLLLGPGVTQ